MVAAAAEATDDVAGDDVPVRSRLVLGAGIALAALTLLALVGAMLVALLR